VKRRPRAAACWALASALALAVPPAVAASIVVRPGQSLAEAIARAADGDEVLIEAGDHRGQVAVITQKRLTLRGVGGRPVLHAAGQAAERKAILVVRDGDVRIENIEFRGARVPDRNGAGIRFEKGRLQVLRCAFFDNENGVLTANFGDAELEIADSEFGNAPADTPLPHLVYVGRIARFTLSGSRVRAGNAGHLVKSRALQSFIRYNELVDGPGGRAAYELEFPNGGLAVVVGNVIGQSEETTNPVVVSFAAEGADDRPRTHGLYMSHNTLVNEATRPALFVRVREPVEGQKLPLRLFNNLFVGLGASNAGWGQATQGNFPIPRLMLRDIDGFDFRLGASSWLRGWAVEVPTLPDPVGAQLRPVAQFNAPAGTRPLPANTPLHPGALQID
jgi:hypothetical protein